MKDTLQILFGLLGGLAIFIFGMNMMSECLQKAAGLHSLIIEARLQEHGMKRQLINIFFC